MNWIHRWLCRTGQWRRAVGEGIVPWTLAGLDDGGEWLEIGPGPGAATGVLAGRAGRLTCVELDAAYARGREGVRMVRGDGAALPFRDGSFDRVVCFTMLHHLPSAEAQDRLLREAARVLRPGGWLAGADSLDGWIFRALHWGDGLTVVVPAGMGARLVAAGFGDVEVEEGRRLAFRFRGRVGVR